MQKIIKIIIVIVIIEENIFKFEEEKDDLSSQLEYLQEEYEYDEELISILKDQLKSYGIEPYEL